MTVLTGKISTVDHVSSPSERALDDGSNDGVCGSSYVDRKLLKWRMRWCELRG